MSDAHNDSLQPAPVLPPPSDDAATQRRDPRLRGALIAAAVILVFLGWQLLDTRYELRNLREEIARRSGESDARERETRLIARSGQEGAQSLQGRVSAVEARQQESESQQAALERLYQEFSRSRDDRLLQDVEQALSMASQQLQLAGNVPVAISALLAADARLAASGQPRFLPLRRLLGQDIERLRNLPLADVSGMSLQLETMLSRIDQLPLAFERQPAPVTAPAPQEAPGGFAAGLRQLGADLWHEFRTLVRVERLDGNAAPELLAPGQSAFLRENIRLRLLSARLALLQRDGRVFAEDIRQVRELIERHFDRQARPVASVLEELRQMSAARLVVDLPELTETEAALRRLRQAR